MQTPAIPFPPDGRRWAGVGVTLGVTLALYAVALALAPGGPVAHVHTVVDLARLAGPWAVAAVPVAVVARALALGAALDVTGALSGWGVNYAPRVGAAVAAEVVFALNAVVGAVALQRGADAPPTSLASVLSASASSATEWAHAPPLMIGIDDLVAVCAVALIWSWREQRPAGGAFVRSAAAYGASVALLLAVLTLGAL